MKSTAERVREEMDRFRKALSSLPPELAGMWVVFKDGRVASVHDTEERAYVAGREAFGKDGGHVVAQVAEIHVVPMTAAVMFSGC